MSNNVESAGYLGNVKAGRTLRFCFSTFDSAGGMDSLSGSPSIRVLKNNVFNGIATGVTLTTDFGSNVGLNLVEINTGSDGSIYSAGSDFTVIINVGSVGGNSYQGTVVGLFSIENRTIAGQGGAVTGGTTFSNTSGSGLTCTSSGGSGLTCSSTGGSGDGLTILGNGGGQGLHATGGASGGNGILAEGGSGSATGVNEGCGIYAQAGFNGDGLNIQAPGDSDDNNIRAIRAYNGLGTAVSFLCDGIGDGLNLSGNGSGKKDLKLGTPSTNILDGIDVTAPTTVAATFREMLIQVWRRLFKKVELDTNANTIKTFADNGSTVITTQTAVQTSTTQTQGGAT